MAKILLTPSKIVFLFFILIKSHVVFGVSLNSDTIKKTDNVETYFDVNATLTQVAATCANNGSVTAVATGATSSPSLYLFKITNGPTANGQTYPFIDQFDESTFTFRDLYPGVYQVTIEDSGDANNPIFVGNITVVDNTEILNFSMTSTSPNCPSENTGSITVTTSSGAGPYQYQIIDGPSGTTTAPIDNASTTHVFNNLPSGNYRIRVFDACGDFQTRNHSVNASSSSTVFLFNERVNRISCTEAVYSVRASGASSSNYTFEVVGGAPAGYPSTNTTGSFTLPIDQAPYTISVSGSCGQSDTQNINNDTSNVVFGVSNKTCTDFDLRLNPNDWMVGPFTFTLTNAPSGYVGSLINTTGDFDDMPYGDYNYTVTDSCGTTVSGSGSAETDVVDITSVLVEADSCSEDLGTVAVFYNSGQAVGPVSIELTTVPAGFAGNAGPQTGNFFDDLVVGNYIATATDACGNTDTYAFEFREEDTLNVDFDIDVIQGCVNAHTVEVSVTTNTGGGFGAKWFNLIDVATGNRVNFTASFFGPATFNDVAAGEYYIEYDIFAGCSINSDNFTIDTYEQPRLTPLSSYVCTNSAFVTVSGITQGGVGPFNYSLINSANNQVLATNNECYFTNLDPALNYKVRIEDNCGNSSSAQVTPIAVGLGLEFKGSICAPIGDPFSIYLRRYTGVDYNWTFPNGSTFNGSDPRSTIGTITNSDYGLYTIVASTFDGCRSQTLYLDFNQCPPPSIDFDGVDDYISAPNSFSISDMEELTIQFWVKANSASQVLGGIVGQRGVLEVTKDVSLGYNFTGQGASGVYSKSAWLDHADTWQHVSIVYNAGEIKTYYNGHLDHVQPSMGITRTAISDNVFNIGGRTGIVGGSAYFHGWIDEVRVFDTALTDTQIQQIIYQEIENNNGNVRGTVIPKDIKDFSTGEPLLWSHLKLYYKMGTTFTADDRVIDYSGNENHGTIFNIRTWQEETAPMPYVTSQDGNWDNASTWLNGDVWDIPSSTVFSSFERTSNDSDDLTTSSIVKISHDVTFNQNVEGVTQMGLIIDNGNTLTVTDDKYITNRLYLELNGTIDLETDSQLIQTQTSDLVTSSNGKILRRQEGTSSPYWYNYWSSPVGTTGTTSLTDNNASSNNSNNTPFSLDMLKDDSGFNCDFTSNYSGNGSISTYWLYTYKNGLTYWDWDQILPATALTPAIGYTQKGTGTAAPEQQYIFEGKPNNGTILVPVEDVGGSGSVAGTSKTEFLLGNPYPSALDVHKFIDDNEGVIVGTLQVWQQWSGTSHNLDEYDGGYAQINKTGAVRAVQFVGLLGETKRGFEDTKVTTKVPTKYLPVGQGFIVEVLTNGNVEFNNSQRLFIKESDANGSFNNGSVFLKSNNKKGKSTSSKSTADNVMQKMRLEFSSVTGPETKRELLLGFSEATKDGYDYGYDAETHDLSNNDLNLTLDGKNMNIQAYGVMASEKVVPLSFRSSGDNTFEIKALEFQDIAEDQDVYLHDKLTGVYFNLREGTAYGFSSEQGVFNERFELVFQNEQQSLSAEIETITENHVYYKTNINTIYVKKLNSDVSKLSVVNMRGQTIMEMEDVSRATLENGLQLPNMSTGTYIVVFRTESNTIISKKIIKP